MSYASSAHSLTPPPSPLSQASHTPAIASSSRRQAPGVVEASSSSGTRRSTEDSRSKQDAKIDQLIQHLYSKAANVISSARLTPGGEAHGKARAPASADWPSPTPARRPTAKRIDKWFNLEMEDPDLFREELRTWRSVTSHLNAPHGTVPPLVLDVLLDTSDLPPSRTLVLTDSQGRALRVGEGRKSPNILLERWTIELRSPAPPNPPPLPGVYKQGIILFRALAALVQALPSADLQRRLQRRMGGLEDALKIGCRLSAGDNLARLPDDEYGLGEALTEDRASAAVDRFPFAPIQTPVGCMLFSKRTVASLIKHRLIHLECAYRKQVDFGVQTLEAVMSSHFFDEDYYRAGPTVRQKTAVPGSMPSAQHLSFSPPLVANRPSYGSLSSRHLLDDRLTSSSPQRQPSTSPRLGSGLAGYMANQEGAFITASRTRPLSMAQGGPAEASAPTNMPRRPSVGQSHPFKGPSPSSHSPSPLRPPSSASPRDIVPSPTGRMSSSPGFGPSSSLRYQSPTYFDAAHYTPGSLTGSGGSISRGVPVAIRRYSGRGGYGASSSSGGSGSPAPGAGPGSYSASKSRLSTSAKRDSLDQPTPEERDEISAFLDMLDQRPAISPASKSSGISRSAADERLRMLAGSMYREGEPTLLRTKLGRHSIEEERPSPSSSSPPAQGSGAASLSSGVNSQPVASGDSFPRYVSSRHSRRRSSLTFDELEAVGRLELSHEESPSSGAEPISSHASPGPPLHQPVPHLASDRRRSSRPASAMSSRRESSAERDSLSSSTGGIVAAHNMPLGRGRGRPGRHAQEREREWEERRQGRGQRSAGSSVAGSSRASSRASSEGEVQD